MLTLKKFKATLEIYGADLTRWPQTLRSNAYSLLTLSSEARASFDEARAFDDAIESARIHDRSFDLEESNAALTRLRYRVQARIASDDTRLSIYKRFTAWLRSGNAQLSLSGAGMIAAVGVTVITGLVIGATYKTVPFNSSLFSMLQPPPIRILAD
jgi:hypothetical protein